MFDEKLPYKELENINEEFVYIVRSILENEEFIKRKLYHHHENRSVYGHSLLVSIRSYKLAKLLDLDYKAAAIGGLLHDFYYNDWQITPRKGGLSKAHGFMHAKEAFENAKQLFPEIIDKKVENIIKRHMFPLTFVPPLYLESWLICLVDKYCSMEVFNTPNQLYKYIGLKKKVN